MKKIIIILFFVAMTCINASVMLYAQKLSPMQKALQAIAARQLLQEESGKNTATAEVISELDSSNASIIKNAVPEEKKPETPDPYLSNNDQGVDPLGLTTAATAEIIIVSWNNSAAAWADFEGYRFLRQNLTGDHAQSVTRFATSQTQYQDVSVTANVYYEYQVTAVDIYGNSLLSSGKMVTKLAPSVPPLAPEEVTADSLPERTHIKWKKSVRQSHDITGYLVHRKNTVGNDEICLNPEKPVQKEEYHDNHGEINRIYEYYVTAVDNRGLTSTASNTITASARMRDRNSLTLMPTAYRGLGRMDTGLNADLQFTYYIGTLYGDQDPVISKLPLYLDPISLWLLTSDLKYTVITDTDFPLAAAVGTKNGIQIFARQQSTASGSFSFSDKSELDYLWGVYAAISKTFGASGLHAGYMAGNYGDIVFYLSKYLEPEKTSHMVYMGVDFPIVRRMNATLEIMYPMNSSFTTVQQPFLVNLHVDRLFNFDISYLQWKQGWAVLGYFNLCFTVFPGR